MRHFILLFLYSLILIFIQSCTKTESQSAPVQQSGNGSLFFHLHTYADTNEVSHYDSVYILSGGRRITVHRAQLYISNIRFVKSDGSLYNVPNTIVLKDQEIEIYFVGNVPAGNYSSLRFTVGLDSVTNLKVPASIDTALNNSSMWFGSTAQPQGYVFVNFQGTIDTTTNASATNLIPFKYLIGTNSNRRQVMMPTQNITITSNQTQYIHILIDYNKLFNGVQLNSMNNLQVMNPSDNTGGLATKIANNIPLMFSYEY